MLGVMSPGAGAGARCPGARVPGARVGAGRRAGGRRPSDLGAPVSNTMGAAPAGRWLDETVYSK